jgi:hypothetical protein
MENTTVTKTAQFMTPVASLSFRDGIYNDYYIGSYLGADDYVESSTIGEKFVLVYKEEVPTIDEQLQAKPQFEAKYESTTRDGKAVVYVFTIPQNLQEKVVKPFLEGAYSKVDRTYVEEHFPDTLGSRLKQNRMIFDKHPAFRKYWEDRIGTPLPDDAEVWSRPKVNEEVWKAYTTSTT